jgi:hypothetical protein
MGRRLIKMHPQVKPEVIDMSSSSDLRKGYGKEAQLSLRGLF